MYRSIQLTLLLLFSFNLSIFAQSETKQGDDILSYSRGGDYRLNEGSLGSTITTSFVVLGPGIDTQDAYVTYGFNINSEAFDLELDFRAGTDEGSGTLQIGFYNFSTQSFDYVTMSNSNYDTDVAYTFQRVLEYNDPSDYLDSNGNLEVQFKSSDGWYIDWVRLDYTVNNDIDLVVQAIDHSPDSPQEGESVTVEVVLQNTGDDPSGSFNWRAEVNGQFYGEESVDNINGNRSILREFVIDNLQEGQYIVNIEVDSGNDVTETNEGNNSRNETINVLAAQDIDLRIQGIDNSPDNPVDGDNVTIEVVLQNAGDDNSGAFEWQLFVNGDLHNTYNESGLNGNRSELREITLSDLSEGGYIISAEIDTDNDVEETNEGNNSRNHTFDVNEVTTISVSPSSLTYSSSQETKTVSITSNTTWGVSDNQTWITVSGADENGDDGSVSIQVSENTSTSSRSGTVTFTTSDGNASAAVSVTQEGISDPTADVAPFAESPQTINQEYWVEIRIGETDEVEDLYGVSFKLATSDANTNYVPDSAEEGDLLGNSVIAFFEPVDNQTVDMGITKTSGSGVSGSGMVASAKFKSSQAGMVGFNLEDFEALDSNGDPIIFDINTIEIEITEGISVWPGDTNHDGVVNSFDVLFVGQCYGEERPGENNPGNKWQIYIREDWECVCEDANGDGIVDARDILPIGLNYGNTHNDATNAKAVVDLLEISPVETSPIVTSDNGYLNIEFQLTEQVYGISGSISSSFGVNSTALVFDHTLTSDDYLSFIKINDQAQTIDFALSSLNQSEIINNGKIFSVKIKVEEFESLKGDIDISNLNLISAKGEVSASSGFTTTFDVTSIDENIEDSPYTLSLSSNYPNPFNPSTTISYTLDKKVDVRLSVYSMSGQLISNLVVGNQAAGEYSVVFDASGLASGNYIYRLEAGDKVLTRSMTLIK